MRHAIRYDEELRLLGELYEELAGLGLNVGFRDALPGLTVTTDVPGVPLYVFVSESGTDFDWHNAAMRHPVGDPAGAARRIAAFLREHRTGGR
ncbi:hypothetical protein [Actinoallomurus acaciae]|uniref:DUF302 domain-containing protein n=1 Tax=Actinoallomurus acaciae TaxID=502577 RepID=A0ABV5YAX9_9ACTN